MTNRQLLQQILGWRVGNQSPLSTTHKLPHGSSAAKGAKFQRIRRYRVFIEGVEQAIFCTQREMEIVLCLQQELVYTEISRKLGISPRTIESHVKRMRTKLDCKDRYALTKKQIDFLEETGSV